MENMVEIQSVCINNFYDIRFKADVEKNRPWSENEKKLATEHFVDINSNFYIDDVEFKYDNILGIFCKV